MILLEGFDWDVGNIDKVQKHGVDCQEVEHALRSAVAMFEDPEHSSAERRIRVLGRNAEGRAVFMAVTYRERDGLTLLRPISARYMHGRELATYGQETSTHFGQ